MTFGASMSARQGFNGAPITVSAAVTSDNPNVDLANNPFVFLGTTATSTPPATFGALAQHDNGGTTNDVFSSPVWDVMQYQQGLSSQGGVAGPNKVTFSLSKFERLSPFVAGQFMWLLVFEQVAFPVGGDAPTIHAGPFHIA